MNEHMNKPTNWIEMERKAESLWAEADRLIERNIRTDSHEWDEINQIQEEAHKLEIGAKAARKVIYRR